MRISVIMITENSSSVFESALKSVSDLYNELLVGDTGSTDGTVEMVKKYGGTVIRQKQEVPLGERKQELVERAKSDWVLVLDADERVSEELKREIGRLGDGKRGREVAFRIPYQNYVFGRPVYFGGEKYAKVRLFKKGFARVSPEALHEDIILSMELPKARPSQRPRPGLEEGNVGELRGVIHHHSYRSPWQLFSKFTRYAWVAARMDPRLRGDDKKGDGTSLKRLFLYGPHMFWARYVKEKGYKDGWRGLVLALAFGYMEGLTYWLIFTRPPLAKAKGVAFKTP